MRLDRGKNLVKVEKLHKVGESGVVAGNEYTRMAH